MVEWAYTLGLKLRSSQFESEWGYQILNIVSKGKVSGVPWTDAVVSSILTLATKFGLLV